MNRTLFAALSLALGAVLLLIPARAPVRAAGADTRVLVEADKEFDGLEGFSAFISDDMTTIRENQAIVRGKPAFLEGWAPLFAASAVSLRWQPELARISDDGTLGFTVGGYTTTKTESNARRKVGSGKYVTIWRKQADGSWKVIFDAGVHDAAPDPQPQ